MRRPAITFALLTLACTADPPGGEDTDTSTSASGIGSSASIGRLDPIELVSSDTRGRGDTETR